MWNTVGKQNPPQSEVLRILWKDGSEGFARFIGDTWYTNMYLVQLNDNPTHWKRMGT